MKFINGADEVNDDLVFLFDGFAVEVIECVSGPKTDYFIMLHETGKHPMIEAPEALKAVSGGSAIETFKATSWAEMMTVVNNIMNSARNGGA